jgi:hypothetical protein
MNGRWLMRREMGPNRDGYSATENPPAGAKPPRDTGLPAFHDPENVKGRTLEREPVTAVVAAEVKLLVGVVDSDGRPGNPVSCNPVTIAGRDLPQQFAALCEKAAAQALQRLKETG